ncbi:uncharacterized protein [Epargyreus clarus]|uniref:uncharacterized protein n=1 Tax=Epargyreus clarus TaxID=520877 RepID=UPI003C2B7581
MMHLCHICKKISVNLYICCTICDLQFDLECLRKYRPHTRLPSNVPQIEIENWYCSRTCARNVLICIDDDDDDDDADSVITIESDDDSKDGKTKPSSIITLKDDSNESTSCSEIEEPPRSNCPDNVTQNRDMKQSMEKLKRSNKIIKQQFKAMRKSHARCKDAHESYEQNDMLNELEILGVPETPSENLVQLLTHIFNKVGVYVTEADVDYVQRIRLGLSKAAVPFDARETMHNPIVVKFVRRLLKVQLLKASKRMGPITTENVVKCEPRPIGIYERLIVPKRELFREVYYRSKLFHYENCWVENGNIYVVDKGGRGPYHIDSFHFMDHFIGRVTPAPKGSVPKGQHGRSHRMEDHRWL